MLTTLSPKPPVKPSLPRFERRNMTSEIAKSDAVLDRRYPAQPSRPTRNQTSCAPAPRLSSPSSGFARKRETVFQTVHARLAIAYFARSHKTARSLTREAVRSADRRRETPLPLAVAAPRARFLAGTGPAVFRCRPHLS